MDYEKQVNKEHYSFSRYFHKQRWMSYWYQSKEIISRPEIKSVLDIGPGTDFLKNLLAIHRPDIVYHSLDVAADIEPDVLGSVTKIPLENNSYNVVCAFQILEHIEFKDFDVAVSEICRVSSKYAFISLPHFGPSLELQVKVPLIPRIQWATKIPFSKKHFFNGEHYWEIGKAGYPVKRIKNVLESKMRLIEDYVPFENQYHHFFIGEVTK